MNPTDISLNKLIGRVLLRYPVLLFSVGLASSLLVLGSGLISQHPDSYWDGIGIVLVLSSVLIISRNETRIALLSVVLGCLCGFFFSLSVQKANDFGKDWEHVEEVQIKKIGTKNSLYVASAVGYDTESYCQLKFQDHLVDFQRGDVLRIRKRARKIVSTPIAGQFDYQEFMKRKDISHQLKLTESDYDLIHSASLGKMQLVRQKMKRHIDTIFPESDQRALMMAFILGDRRHLSEDLCSTFRRSGAMHILAVSGLHVGIVVCFLSVIFSLFFGNRNWERFLKMILSISALWLFAALTDFSVSVCRAAFMFSLFSVSRLFTERFSFGINTLLVSGIALLAYNPNFIFDIGFQFSYLAVLGILLFARPIKSIFSTGNFVMNYIWTIITVSISAQVFILPFSLFYFHETSVLSVASSIFAIPAAFVILSAGFILIFLDMIIPSFVDFAANIFCHFIDCFFNIIGRFSDLPWAVKEFQFFDAFLVFLSCLVPFSLYLTFAKKSDHYLLFSALLFSLLISYQFHGEQRLENRLWVVQYEDEKTEIWSQGIRYNRPEAVKDWSLDRLAYSLGYQKNILVESDIKVMRKGLNYSFNELSSQNSKIIYQSPNFKIIEL